jgi:hypothetical protein
MNQRALSELVGGMESFDLALLAQAFAEPRASLRVQLSRLMTQGTVIGLRQGIYTLSDTYRHVPVNPATLANHLYRPSYLSGLWALGYYDMIPERVVWLTSVTPRVPRRFENPFGVFDYQNIKQGAFFGYVMRPFGAGDVLVAEPEKALLDYWHLTPGEWTLERLAEMRYQQVERVDAERLRDYAGRFSSPRLSRAVERWLTLTTEESEGTVTL